MKFVFPAVIFMFVVSLGAKAQAQLDSSYELLLGNNASSGTAAPPAVKKAPTKKRKMASDEAATNVQATATATATTETKVEVAKTLPVKAEVKPNVEEPSLTQQAESIFSNEPNKATHFYEEQFEDKDPRQNKIEISFAPSYISNESSSNFSYRNYRSVFTGVGLGANVWLTPALGVGGNFIFSLGGDTSGDAVTQVRSAARYEFLEVGVKFRKFFGFTTLSKSVEFDLLYSENKFNVASDDMYRIKYKSTGPGIKMTLRLPSSSDVAWLVGGSLYPRLQQSESKTGIDVNSGHSAENTRLGIQLGSEIQLSRESQVFYEASVSSEKNMFDGLASGADPATGSTPKNVSITNTFYMFSLGYRWGN